MNNLGLMEVIVELDNNQNSFLMYVYTLYKNREHIPYNEKDINVIVRVGECLEHWDSINKSGLLSRLEQASIAANKVLGRIKTNPKPEEFGLEWDVYYIVNIIANKHKEFMQIINCCNKVLSDDKCLEADNAVLKERIEALVDDAYEAIDSFKENVFKLLSNGSITSEQSEGVNRLGSIIVSLNALMVSLSGELFSLSTFDEYCVRIIDFCRQLKEEKKEFKLEKEFNKLLFKLFTLVEALGMTDRTIEMEIEMFKAAYNEDKQEGSDSRESIDTTSNKYIKISNSTGAVFPDDDYLDDYEDSHITDLISTLGIEVTIGNGLRKIGDSGISVEIQNFVFPGDVEYKHMKAATKEFVDIIRTALSTMSKKYADFYKHFLDDFEKNGFNMPGL